MPDKSKKGPKNYVTPSNIPRMDYMDYTRPIPFASDEKVVNWIKDYMSSPKYRERLSRFYPNPENVTKKRINQINKAEIVNDADSDIHGAGQMMAGWSNAGELVNRIALNRGEQLRQGLAKEETLAHELSHIANSNLDSDLRLLPSEENYLFSKERQLGRYAIKGINDFAAKNDITLSEAVIKNWAMHDAAPSEIKSDIDAFRFLLKEANLYDAGTQDMNREVLNKAKKDKRINNSFLFKRLQDHYSDDDIIDIMNNIAATTSVNQPVAKRGGSINNNMRNSYQLAGSINLPGFLGDLYNTGQNLNVTPVDVGLGLTNYFGNLFADKVADRDNQSYEDYWRRQYQIPSTVINPYAFGDPDQMEKGGIHIKPENKGKFTRWAKARGMGVQEAARKVLAAKEGTYSPSVRKMANFARNFGGKKAIGGELGPGDNPNIIMNPTDEQRIRAARIGQLAEQWGVPSANIFSKVKYGPQDLEGNRIPDYTNYYTFDAQGKVLNSITDRYEDTRRGYSGQSMYTAKYTTPTAIPTLTPSINPRMVQPSMMFGGPIPFGYKLNKHNMTLSKMYRGGTYFKHGGEVNYSAKEVDAEDANIEAEKGEYILGIGMGQNPLVESSNIGVGLYKIGGNKHYNGGTKLRANPGDFVFSDDKSLSFSEEFTKDLIGKTVTHKKNRTPAKLAGKFSNLNDFVTEAQGDKVMPLDRKTALLNVENIMDKLADIAISQEALKGFPDGMPAFAQVSLDKRLTPSMETAGLDQSSASLPMAKYGGQMKTKYAEAGIVFPFFNILGEPWKGDKTKDKKGVFQNPRDNRFPGNYPEFENRIQQAGFTGDINDNRQIQTFLYNNLMQTPQGRSELGSMWNQYGITNYGQQLAGMTLPANFNLQELTDPTSNESVRLQNWGNFYDDGKIGVRTRMLADSLNTPRPPITGWAPPTDDPNNIPGLGRPTPSLVQPPTATVTPSNPPINRNYNTPVNPNIAELYGLLAANRRFPSRYPTAQRFYEGENIDAQLNAGFQPTSAQPILNNIQRQLNTFNENNSGYGPISYARNAYGFTQALNAQNNAIAQNQLQNVQRRDQLTQSLAQNQALKGQYRLQLQDKYLRELETLNNNRELAAKNRMSQTSNLLNSYVNRAYTQRYANSMMDYFEIDPNGNLRPRTGINARQAIMEQSSSNQMGTQLRQLEQVLKLMQQYGIKSTGFVDDILKGAR